MSEEKKMVEIIEPEQKKAPEAVKVPTREDLKEKGWSAAELEKAEKRGMLGKTEEKKAETPKSEAKAPEGTATKSETPEAKPEHHKKAMPDLAMTPEQETKFKAIFPPGTNVNGIYFGMRNERTAKQKAIQERDAARAEMAALKARLEALEKPAPKQETDLDGNLIDPEDKPLTVKALRELESKKEAERAKKEEELNTRTQRVVHAQQAQEEYARDVVYKDFDETLKLAAEVMKDPEMLGDKWRQDKALRLMRDLQVAAARADELAPDEYNAAIIAYEIGAMHPNHGKAANGAKADGNEEPKSRPKDGGLSPEQLKRAEENTQRRQSSAAIPSGGGKRSVAAEEVTLEQFLRFSYKQREEFRKNHPDAYTKLKRG